MSGCAVCIYDLYIESKESYRKALSSALAKVESMQISRETWPKALLSLSNSRARQRDQSLPSKDGYSLRQDGDGEDDSIVASMNAFVELEKRLKQQAANR